MNPASASGTVRGDYLKDERGWFYWGCSPNWKRKLDLNGRTLVFELEWNKPAEQPQAREISRFPANRRDIAVVAAENVPQSDILSGNVRKLA